MLDILSMTTTTINHYLQRIPQETALRAHLSAHYQQRADPLAKKGIYIYGPPGSGKTRFVKDILKSMGYDWIEYNASDIRNTSVIDDLAKHTISDVNVMSLLQGKRQRIAVIMDEIDGMNNGDKGGINALIKLIRPKKTKKQKNEQSSLVPIICIGNYKMDKKIKELMKVCECIELAFPSSDSMRAWIQHIYQRDVDDTLLAFIGGDLRKAHDVMRNVDMSHFYRKSANDDTKTIVHRLLQEPMQLHTHAHLINDTDRTSVGLLWHENVIDVITDVLPANTSMSELLTTYLAQLDNMCFADFIDRITFQKQIWQFNELSSLIKTYYNHHLFHSTLPSHASKLRPDTIRFTKVLTKYSTEYNNQLFVQRLCQSLNMDRKDAVAVFYTQRPQQLDDFDINKLDCSRMLRLIEKYVNANAKTVVDTSSVDDVEEDHEEDSIE